MLPRDIVSHIVVHWGELSKSRQKDSFLRRRSQDRIQGRIAAGDAVFKAHKWDAVFHGTLEIWPMTASCPIHDESAHADTPAVAPRTPASQVSVEENTSDPSALRI